MEDSFIIGAYWGSRIEPLTQIVDKVLLTLEKLKETDVQFIKWYELGMSRKKALESKVSIDADIIRKLSLTRVRKGELDDNGVSKFGFLFSLWTGHKDEESSKISFNVGASFDTEKLSNSCVIKIPYKGEARLRLLQTSIAKNIMDILIEVWNPDYAVLTSDGLRDKLNAGNKIGWMTYTKLLSRIPKISDKVIYEEYSNKAHFFYLNSYDYSLINELMPLR